jgi:hypothetical protein
VARKGKYGVNMFSPNHPMNQGDANLQLVRAYCVNCRFCHPYVYSTQVAQTDMSEWGEPKPKNAILKCSHPKLGILKPRRAQRPRSLERVYVKPVLITTRMIGKCKLLSLQDLLPTWGRLWRDN